MIRLEGPMKNTMTAVTSSLLLAGTITLAATASADGHETVESLKAELAGMQSKLDQVSAGRDYLTERLKEHLAGSKEMQAELQSEIDSANQGREYMAGRLETLHGQSYAKAAALAADVAKARADGDSIADVAFVQINGALAERDSARAEIAAAKAANATLASDMESVINGRTYIEKLAASAKAAASGLKQELAAAKAANAKLASDMESVINGRTYIEKLAASAKTAAAADIATAASEKAKLESQLATAVEGSSLLMGRWENTQAELTSMKGKAAKAEQAANWGNTVSAQLTSQLDYLSDVDVAATSDNKVNLRIGSAGMFKSGSKNLSNEGKKLLEQVGQALLGQSDATILITGHTDNIPTGEGSRYKDNVELSNHRAEEAMNHLGGAAGIELERMSSFGVGDTQPLTSNATPEGRELNRRVEIILSAK
jgi:chemotaxis protein MotB